MALTFHPRPGMVLICDFNTGFKAPEMVKRRPVVVISPRPRRSNQLCTIVPLSTTVPNPVEPFHHRMDPRSLPGKLAGKETWAKCNMLATVSLERFDRVMVGKDPRGKRTYVAVSVTAGDLKVIRRGVMIALGLPGHIRLVPVDNSLIFINFMNRLRAKRTDSLTNRFFLLSIRPV